jgi:hypothetical protein
METFNKELNKDEDPEQDFSCPTAFPLPNHQAKNKFF